jgi:hypothetical protein
MAKLYKLSTSLAYSTSVGIPVAVIFGVIAALSSVVANIDTTSTVEIVCLAIVAGLTAGLQHISTESET